MSSFVSTPYVQVQHCKHLKYDFQMIHVEGHIEDRVENQVEDRVEDQVEDPWEELHHFVLCMVVYLLPWVCILNFCIYHHEKSPSALRIVVLFVILSLAYAVIAAGKNGLPAKKYLLVQSCASLFFCMVYIAL